MIIEMPYKTLIKYVNTIIIIYFIYLVVTNDTKNIPKYCLLISCIDKRQHLILTCQTLVTRARTIALTRHVTVYPGSMERP